jgi:hypothetical protein
VAAPHPCREVADSASPSGGGRVRVGSHREGVITGAQSDLRARRASRVGGAVGPGSRPAWRWRRRDARTRTRCARVGTSRPLGSAALSGSRMWRAWAHSRRLSGSPRPIKGARRLSSRRLRAAALTGLPAPTPLSTPGTARSIRNRGSMVSGRPAATRPPARGRATRGVCRLSSEARRRCLVAIACRGSGLRLSCGGL